MMALFAVLSAGAYQAHAQVVYKEYLSKDHDGILERSVSLDGDDIEYRFESTGADEGAYYFRLTLIDRSAPTHVMDIKIRDLIVTTYFDIPLYDDGALSTLMIVFDKTNKWLKPKMVPHKGCSRPAASWKRYEDISTFDQMLNLIVRFLDKNLILESCYRAE